MGGQTVRQDNPRLTTRRDEGHIPTRVLLSRTLDLPEVRPHCVSVNLSANTCSVQYFSNQIMLVSLKLICEEKRKG